jgi:hypothetical protein
MTQVLSRHHINPEICFHQWNIYNDEITTFDYSQICSMIDYWKFMLVERYDARPGKTVMIEFNNTNIYYFTAIYAAWELGLTLIVDWPHAQSEQTCHSEVFRVHGKIDYAIVYSRQLDPTDTAFYSKWDVLRTQLHCQEIITEKDFDNYTIVDHQRYQEITTTIYATPTTQAIWTATSGSTGAPKQQRIDHNSVVQQAKRLCTHLNFEINTTTLHTNNLHHGASACYHFLPSMMMGKDHWIFCSKFDNADLTLLNNLIVEKKINKLFLYTPDKLLSWLQSAPILKHQVDITTLYYCTKEIVQLSKEKNVRLIKSVFGDTTIGYGFLVKTVDCRESLDHYEANKIGPKLDDFFDFKIEKNSLYVSIPGLNINDWRTSYDTFELKDNQYYFLGRGTDYRINHEWINHQEIEDKIKSLFDVDGEEGATIIVDNEEQQIYLAVWIANSAAEKLLDIWMNDRYKTVYISKKSYNLNKNDFMGSRKVSRPMLREHFRKNVTRLVSYTSGPWCLS